MLIHLQLIHQRVFSLQGHIWGMVYLTWNHHKKTVRGPTSTIVKVQIYLWQRYFSFISSTSCLILQLHMSLSYIRNTHPFKKLTFSSPCSLLYHRREFRISQITSCIESFNQRPAYPSRKTFISIQRDFYTTSFSFLYISIFSNLYSYHIPLHNYLSTKTWPTQQKIL